MFIEHVASQMCNFFYAATAYTMSTDEETQHHYVNTPARIKLAGKHTGLSMISFCRRFC